MDPTMGCIKNTKYVSMKDMTSQDYFTKPKANLGVQENHLKDAVRMRAYKEAIIQNREAFKDKVVLDVCCGSGILSLFAAAAGAKKVIAVDNNCLLELTEQVVRDNKLQNVISVELADIKEWERLPGDVEKVDVILCDWIGDCLLNESCIDSLLHARERWLVEGGLVFPDLAGLYVAAIEDTASMESKATWWGSVYNFDMTPIRDSELSMPAIETVSAERLVSNACLVKEVDAMTNTEEDLNFESPFFLVINKDDNIHALVLYFEVHLAAGLHKVGFSTSPRHPSTHWKQTKLYLQEDLLVNRGDEIAGVIRMQRRKDCFQKYEIEIELRFDGKVSRSREVRNFMFS